MVVLGPIQIALLEMIIDPVCALVFEAEPEEGDLMRRRPRDPKERLFSMPMVVRSVGEGIVAFVALAALYLFYARQGLAPAELRTLVFFALVAAVLALILADRSFSTSLRDALLRGNATFRYIFAAIVTMAVLVLTVPPLQRLLQFAPLHPGQLLAVGVVGIALLILLERIKRLSPRS